MRLRGLLQQQRGRRGCPRLVICDRRLILRRLILYLRPGYVFPRWVSNTYEPEAVFLPRPTYQPLFASLTYVTGTQTVDWRRWLPPSKRAFANEDPPDVLLCPLQNLLLHLLPHLPQLPHLPHPHHVHLRLHTLRMHLQHLHLPLPMKWCWCPAQALLCTPFSNVFHLRALRLQVCGLLVVRHTLTIPPPRTSRLPPPMWPRWPLPRL